MLPTYRFVRTGFGLFIVTVTILACGSYPQPVLQKKPKPVILVKHKSSTTALQHQFLEQVNRLRAHTRKCGNKHFSAAAPLTINDRLNQAAYRHSLDMYKNSFLDHVSSNGDTLLDRVEKTNYPWRAVGENIAHNQRSIEHVLQDWLSSPGHCKNMMSSEFRHTGIAQVNWYWTQVYAAHR